MPEHSVDYHTCHFCGENVKDGLTPKGERHWLSDCRPDLVEHEIGRTCTWAHLRNKFEECNECQPYTPCDTHVKIPTPNDCYAFSTSDYNFNEPGTVNGLKWTDEHTHFYKDGPM